MSTKVPLFAILTYMNPVYSLTPYWFHILVLSFNLYLDLPFSISYQPTIQIYDLSKVF